MSQMTSQLEDQRTRHDARHRRVLRRIQRKFDASIMNNVHRGEYIQTLVQEVLGNGWRAPAGFWLPWDIEHADGAKVEVKQSAACQSWDDGTQRSSEAARKKARFGIAPSRSWSVQDGWNNRRARHADIYVFAWHPEADNELADHRHHDEWLFFVVRSDVLPEGQKSIGLSSVELLAQPVDIENLAAAVHAALHS